MTGLVRYTSKAVLICLFFCYSVGCSLIFDSQRNDQFELQKQQLKPPRIDIGKQQQQSQS